MAALLSIKTLKKKTEERGIIGFFQSQAGAKGWPFLASWTQRITGIILIFFVWIHIIFLSSLKHPEIFDTKAKILSFPLFTFFEWALALPVIYHALNGGRIILYEFFDVKEDDLVLKWVVFLSILYSLILGIFMIIGNQTVSAFFFWTNVIFVSLCLVFIISKRVKQSGMSLFWKIQRISGVFLLCIIPAHMLFMHLNPTVGHTSHSILSRMNNPFIKIIYLITVIAVLFHGAYGLLTIIQDYLPSRGRKKSLRSLLSWSTGIITIIIGLIGVKLIFQI